VATKGALISLTKALALELARDGIASTAYARRGRHTADALVGCDAAGSRRGAEEQAAMHLTNRLATADELLRPLCFLHRLLRRS
jgi:NAD(P)-dependent dehydrogenase (short-subunit alcohol dehydrogenase family)